MQERAMNCGRVTGIVMLAAAVFVSGPAFSQYNPATPAGPPPILPPIPPQATPGMNPIPDPVQTDSRSSQLKPVPSIRLGSPARETHNDRAIRCSQQAAVLGVPAGGAGRYIQDCVNY
jgi:hypothetical protein